MTKKEAQLHRELAATREQLAARERDLQVVRESNDKILARNEQLIHEADCGTPVRDNCRNGDPQCYECALYAVMAKANHAHQDAYNEAIDVVMAVLDDLQRRVAANLENSAGNVHRSQLLRRDRAVLGAVEHMVEGKRR